jgi:hypothetical protein
MDKRTNIKWRKIVNISEISTNNDGNGRVCTEWESRCVDSALSRFFCDCNEENSVLLSAQMALLPVTGRGGL